MHLGELDQKLWTALACPTSGLELDSKTLQLIDTDKDGRVRAMELIAAVKWAGGLLKNPDDLFKESSSLPLTAINDSTPEGKVVLESARRILTSLGMPNAVEITAEETKDSIRIFSQTVFNGDGIILAASSSDPAMQKVIEDIIACVGSEPDRSGKPGIGPVKVDQFFAEAAAYEAWFAKSEADPAIMPLGGASVAAAAALRAVKPKIDDYFGRCRLIAFDSRAGTALNRDEKEFIAIAAKDISVNAREFAGFPLASISAGKPLPLKMGLNPAWSDAMAAFCAQVVAPLLGDQTELTETDWAGLVARFAPHEAWLAAKAGLLVDKLGPARVREILQGKAKETLAALIAEDKAEESNANNIAAVDKLVRCHRDLVKLCRNFVNFADFYGRKDKAIFQAGTLYLDQRSCDLCIEVVDAARHGTMAPLAGTYLVYLDCVRKGTGEKKSILAAITGGDADNLMVGRNGVFYDRKGLDYDATVTKIIENPISIQQAFLSPYKKLIRFIETQVAKQAAAADTDANARLTAAAQLAATANSTAPGGAQPNKVDVGIVAALSVALGALGTAFGYILHTVAGVADWQLPLLFIAAVMAISGPSMLIAFLKLRKRNLGPILDANGWAINANAGMTVPFGGSLTAVATVPPHALLDVGDEFAEKRHMWPKFLLVIFLLWWINAYVTDQWHLGAGWYLRPVESYEKLFHIGRFAEDPETTYLRTHPKTAAQTNAVPATNAAPAKP